MNGYREVEVQFHSFLPRHQLQVCGRLYGPAALHTPRRNFRHTVNRMLSGSDKSQLIAFTAATTAETSRTTHVVLHSALKHSGNYMYQL
jgi:hypothetical protein